MHNLRFKKIGFDYYGLSENAPLIAVLNCELKVIQRTKDLTFNLLEEVGKALANNYTKYFIEACQQHNPGSGKCTNLMGATHTEFTSKWQVDGLDGYRIEVLKASRHTRAWGVRVKTAWDRKYITPEGCREVEPVPSSIPAVTMAAQFNHLHSDRASFVLLANHEQGLFRCYVLAHEADMLLNERVGYTLRFAVRLISTADNHQTEKTAEAA